MTLKFRKVFATKKPIIAMVHFGALPGSPLYDATAGLDGIVAGVRKDLHALQDAGVYAVMFGNENDRPYEFKVDTASTATMAFAIGSSLKYDGNTWNAVDPEQARELMSIVRKTR